MYRGFVDDDDDNATKTPRPLLRHNSARTGLSLARENVMHDDNRYIFARIKIKGTRCIAWLRKKFMRGGGRELVWFTFDNRS